MALYSSRSKKSFLEDSINKLPADAFLITAEQHQAYLQGQTDGKVIDFSTEPPSLIDRAPQTSEQLAATERKWRNHELTASDGIVARHRDQRDLEEQPTLTDAEYGQLLSYRAKLRNWPEDAAFPAVGKRPSLIL